MIDLTNLDEIKKLDPKDVYGSTGMLASQCTQIWQDAKAIVFPAEYQDIENIIVCGMGGSAYGGHVVEYLYKDELKVPIYVNSDYHLPRFVNEKSLVILTSYSGTTEECLSNAQESLTTGAKITGLTSGGPLGDFLKQHNFPSLIFNTQFNPSAQPRLGTGYIILGTIALLNQLKMLTVSDDTATNAIAALVSQQEIIKGNARIIAEKLMETIPVIFAGEFLIGNAHIMRNQFNETSKSFSAFSPLPELNHHLMEGLKKPELKKLTALILNSNLYSENIQKRALLTKDVVEKNNIPCIVYDAYGDTQLAQMFNTLSFGGYLTTYLGLLYGLDPSLIPWVDYFKAQLAK